MSKGSKYQNKVNKNKAKRNNDNAKMLVNQLGMAIKKMDVNADQEATTSLRSALASLVSGTYDGGDTMHNVYCDFGYPLQITFAQMWNMYRRFGIAQNAVELPVDITWLTPPEITSNNTSFDADLATLIKKKNLWKRVKGVDTRQRVGRYAGMFMRVKDGLTPENPLVETSLGLDGLIDIIPLYEGQLKVLSVEQGVTAENYGQPTMYQLSPGSEGNRNEHASASANIHPSRVVMAAEGADDGTIYGIPALESIYNSLMDLRKIIGAGGEGFYRNAVQTIVFELTDSSKALTAGKALEAFNTNFDDFIKNRARRSIWTPGLKPHMLSSTLADPKDHFASALNDASAGAKIPATILIGQQTGRLASSEDSRSFLSGINARRENHGTELCTNTLDWLMRYGVLPEAEYEVEWDDLLALSVTEKLENAFKMADINNKQTGIGAEVIFTGDEIRIAGGYEPLDEIIPSGEEDDDLDELDKEIDGLGNLGGEDE